MAALAMLHYLPGFVHSLLRPLGSGPIISFILKLFPRDVTLNIMVLIRPHSGYWPRGGRFHRRAGKHLSPDASWQR